jgi:Holliday junction DNA helicase RuvB
MFSFPDLPGWEKTTLAQVISNEMSVGIRVTSGPAIERPGDLAAILTNLSESDILFIDEIHRLNRSVEEVLYPALEDFALDIIIGKGPSARSIRLDLPRFTLIGATTRAGQLSAPLRDRFGVQMRLELYDPEQLCQIICRSASILEIPCSKEGAMELAKRARGTPRNCESSLAPSTRFCGGVGRGPSTKTSQTWRSSHALKYDRLGLDLLDRRMLSAIALHYGGGPVGLDTWLPPSERNRSHWKIVRTYLMQLGFLARTPPRTLQSPMQRAGIWACRYNLTALSRPASCSKTACFSTANSRHRPQSTAPTAQILNQNGNH